MNHETERNSAGIPLRPLGKTGLKVSIVGFGGGHFVRPSLDEQASVKLVHAAIDAGMTFMDTAWEYHNGESERRMGLALQDRRDKVTLMTKVCARDGKTAEEQLHDSLRRLQTDVIDIWQFHEVNYDNDPDWIFQKGGASKQHWQRGRQERFASLASQVTKVHTFCAKCWSTDLPGTPASFPSTSPMPITAAFRLNFCPK